MKVSICTADPLLRRFLAGILKDAEGIVLHIGPRADVSPDGESGWVLALSAADAGAGTPEQLLEPVWVAGVVIVGFDSAGAEKSADGPYGGLPGVVCVTLPCDISHLVEALSAAGSGGKSADTGGGIIHKPVILVAEDSPLQRSLVVGTLKSEGFEVLEAEDGKAALEVLERTRPDLLITDVEMPRMTGLELVRAVRSDLRFGSLPVLMLTTLSGFEQIKEGFDSGASDYMVKPAKGEREIFLEELVMKVHQLLSRALPVLERRALVVDDSAVTRRMVAGTLSNAGFHVTTAEDGMQAQGLLENPTVPLPDIVVTDLEMPVMDGLRLTHFVKNNPKTRDLPVIILSASTRHEHRVLGKGFGADAFISKPFSEEKLLVTVDHVLVRSRLEKERRELSKITGREFLKAIHDKGLAPHKRVMTILFSDLAGFSNMCSGMEAAEVVTLLNDYFDQLVEFVLREHGYVNKFIGDAVMALFSTLPGLDPPAVRAARAAVEFQREMVRVNSSKETPLLTRIGLNSGEVIMGLIGSGERKDYTVIGDHVNRAQRLESNAPIGGVLLSAGVFEGAGEFLAGLGYVRIEAVEDLRLKGIAGPVTAYAITITE